MDSTIEVRLDNIFFKSFTADSNHGCPLYIFDSTYLPSTEEVESREVYDLLIDELMNKLVTKLPDCAFSLVVFSSGFSQNNVSWIYGLKMFSKIPKAMRVRLQRLYVVHESLFVRSVYQVLTNALNINPFKNKDTATEGVPVQHVSNLAELACIIDITKIRISLNVYLFDYQITGTTCLPDPQVGSRSPLANRQYRQLAFDKIFRRLKTEAPRHELVFQKPGAYQKVNILLGIVARNNYVDLSQWDVYSLGTLFLHFIKGKSKPIFSINLIPLPISESLDYTYNTFVNMMLYNGYYELVVYIFELFLSLLDNSKITLHDYRSLSKCLTPTLCQEKVSIKTSDRLAVGHRYITNVLKHFKQLRAKIDGNQYDAAGVMGNSQPLHIKNSVPLIPPPRKSGSTGETSSNDSFVRQVPLEAKPPPLPKRKTPDLSGDTRHITPPTTSRASSSSSSISENMQNVKDGTKPSFLGTSTGLLSGESLTSTSEVTSMAASDTRIPSDSSISLKEPFETVEARLIAEEAVTFKPKPAENEFKIDENMANLLIENNASIRNLDSELKKKKLESNVKTKSSSNTSYSDIKAGNKVSRLAALYEERLVGIRVMEDMRRQGR
ncbi:LADA_0H03444g1_1 [Lachancea dasiensis]|uniref:LADA_0H03444g1_1 n=1 Tax=Lachancea dasiensis TaxID=1072105 RepID=A0A1G4K097_9SACH|nr:LADA_0H03444g1_1 [Lachancea dasiensis]